MLAEWIWAETIIFGQVKIFPVENNLELCNIISTTLKTFENTSTSENVVLIIWQH